MKPRFILDRLLWFLYRNALFWNLKSSFQTKRFTSVDCFRVKLSKCPNFVNFNVFFVLNTRFITCSSGINNNEDRESIKNQLWGHSKRASLTRRKLLTTSSPCHTLPVFLQTPMQLYPYCLFKIIWGWSKSVIETNYFNTFFTPTLTRQKINQTFVVTITFIILYVAPVALLANLLFQRHSKILNTVPCHFWYTLLPLYLI